MKDVFTSVSAYEKVINSGQFFQTWEQKIYDFGIFSQSAYDKAYWNVDRLKQVVLYDSLQPAVKTIFDELMNGADTIRGKTDAEAEALYEGAWKWRGIEELKNYPHYASHETAIEVDVAKIPLGKLRQLAIERTAIGMATQFVLARHVVENRHGKVADPRDWADSANSYWYEADAGASDINIAVEQLAEAQRKGDKNFASMQLSTIAYELYHNPTIEWKTRSELISS